jgi:hypothetical protein
VPEFIRTGHSPVVAVMLHYLGDDLRSEGLKQLSESACLDFQGIRQDAVEIKKKGLPMQVPPRSILKNL